MKKIIIFLVIITLILGITMNMRFYKIYSNGIVELKNFSLGVSSIEKNENKKNCYIYPYLFNDDNQEIGGYQRSFVEEGMKLKFDSYKVKILKINIDENSKYIIIRITEKIFK